ncbi:sensor histidine kinase [Sphingomonas sp.]|uniref:sensor histidine kinase n=1 Tax=Sphingomonas sp. TaxID=28214 RepID=UPI003AFF9771
MTVANAVFRRADGNVNAVLTATGTGCRGGYVLRFDDSLTTVLAADAQSGFGAQAAWRQLADLIGRHRVAEVDAAIARLKLLRDRVPIAVRVASARVMATGDLPEALVALFAEDEPAVAAPVLRAATLRADEWLALLPRLGPAGRAVLRARRDLMPEVVRGLASFGSTDFVLGHDGPVDAARSAGQIITPTPIAGVDGLARTRPVEAEAPRSRAGPSGFEIADLVARLDAFRRDRPEAPPPVVAPPPSDRFDFHTDAAGVIRWVEGVARTPLIGATFASGRGQGAATLDRAAGEVLHARAPFRDLCLQVEGDSSAAGTWSLAGLPRFDPATGQFTGFAGSGRRSRADAVPTPAVDAADSLRQLVHELRTPANAITGFAEMIGTELLGPVPPVYRERALLIESEAAALVGAIDDLDTAARLQGEALDLRPGPIDLVVPLAAAVAALHPLATARGVSLIADPSEPAIVLADDRAVARLLARLLTVAVASAETGEHLRVQIVLKTRNVRLHVTRPRGLSVEGDDALLAIAPSGAAGTGDGDPLLGLAFTLRLVRDLAGALGGSLAITPDRLTLRLPAAVTARMERATTR